MKIDTQSQNISRVVLLGSGGFIGKAIHRALAKLAVPVLLISSADLDLADASAANKLATLLKPADSVVMLAAITPDKGRDTATLIKNLAIMQSMCTAIEKSGSGHLIYFSSDAVYDTATSRVCEDTPACPQDLYGAMHYTREIMARNLVKLPVLVLRPTLVYGVEDTHNSYGPNRFRRAAQKDGKITLFGNGEETRDHVYVDDIATLVVRCLLEQRTGTLNVATGISKTFFEIAEIVARQFSNPVDIVTTPRNNPITRRHYDVTNLIKSFPDFRFTSQKIGIANVHHQMIEAVSCPK